MAVVITCYNYAAHVRGAIESALMQSVPYEQIIVVDDGSTDDSLARIKEFSDRIIVVEKPNGGHLDACLAGLERVKAPWVHFLDADDRALPTFVERMSQFCQHGVSKVQCQLEVVDGDGRPNGSVYPTFTEPYPSVSIREDNKLMGFYQCTPTSGNVFSTAFLRSLDLAILNPRAALDGAACLAAAYRGDIISINEPLAQYGVHGESLSNSHAAPTVEQFEKELREFRGNWNDACRVLGLLEPPFGDTKPLYVLERELLTAALSGRGTAKRTAAYLNRLASTHLTLKQKMLQGLWITSLMIPNTSWRTQAIMLRRSGSNRPKWLQNIVGFIRRDTKNPKTIHEDR